MSGDIPVKVTAQEAEENPNFVHLLQQLGHLLTPDGLSLEVHKDLKQAEEALRSEKHGWLQSHILQRELQEIILDYDLKSRDSALTIEDQEFKEILEQCLNFAEAEDYLNFTPDPNVEVTLLGLSHEDIEACNSYKKYIPALQQKLIPELEDRLRRKCESLVSVVHGSTLTDSSNLAMAKASQLPSTVERSLRVMEEEKQQLSATREKREKQFKTYFQNLSASAAVLEKMVKEHRLDKQSHSNKVTTEYLATHCDLLCQKVRYMELRIQCDTYNVDTVAALRKIKEHLQEVKGAKETEMQRVDMVLQAYSSVGFGFDDLAMEYGRLRSQLDNKKWALREVAKTGH